MKTNNIIQGKSFSFAIRIVKACRYLRENSNEYVLSKQLLESGTSIGANVEEAIGGQSRADFFAKLTISYKEARETLYWIKLLNATEYLSDNISLSLMNDCEELCKIISKIQITTQNNM